MQLMEQSTKEIYKLINFEKLSYLSLIRVISKSDFKNLYFITINANY